MLRYILFDLDGTLIDSYMDIGIHLNATLKHFGLEEIDIQKVRHMVGGGARELLKRFFSESLEDALRVFRESYMRKPVIHTKPFQHIPEILEDLKSMDIKLGVVTNKMEEISKRILDTLDLLAHFDVIIGGDTLEEKKPSPLPILKALELLGGTPDRALMVGDTDADLIAGKGANVKTALAGWGYVKLNGTLPDYHLHEPRDLIYILKY